MGIYAGIPFQISGDMGLHFKRTFVSGQLTLSPLYWAYQGFGGFTYQLKNSKYLDFGLGYSRIDFFHIYPDSWLDPTPKTSFYYSFYFAFRKFYLSKNYELVVPLIISIHPKINLINREYRNDPYMLIVPEIRIGACYHFKIR